MIARPALRAWLTRPLRDSARAKSASEQTVDRMLAKLDPPPVFHTPPRGLYQKASFLLGVKHPGYCFNLDMGLGKALVNSEPVLTPSGWRPIADLMVGDEVMHPDGSVQLVTGVYPQGDREVVEVEFTDGVKSRCDLDHLWWVKTPAMKRYRCKTVRELMGDLRYPQSRNLKWFVPMAQPQPMPKAELVIDPYVLGVMLGDGCLQRQNFSFSTIDDQLVEAVRSALPPGITLGELKRVGSCRCLSIKGRRGFVWREIEKLGLLGAKSQAKFVPAKYKRASIEQRLSLVQGLLDTDGHAMKQRSFEFSSVSPQLAKDLQYLVRSLGGTARLKLNEGFYKGEIFVSYRVYGRLPMGMAPFRLDRKQSIYDQGTLSPTRSLRRIRRITKPQACTCISVNGRDGLFVTRGFVVTHNTWLMLNLYHYFAVQRGEPGRLLVLVPNAANVGEWQDQAEQHVPDLTFSGLAAGVAREDKEAVLWGGRGVIVCLTFQGLLTVVGKAKPGDKDRSFRLDGTKAAKFGRQFLVMAVDEATFIANHNNSYHKACRSIRRTVGRCYTGTGTPFGRSPDELWGQFRIADEGETLGESIGLYREAFFYSSEDLYKGIVWHFDRTKKEPLARMIRHGSVRYSKDEVMDLPPIIHHRVRLTWPLENLKYHQDLLTELKAAAGNLRLLENTYIRLRGLTAGYLKLIDKQGGEHLIRFKENPKLDAVIDKLRQAPAGDSQIVITAYTQSGDLLAERLKAEKIPFLRLYGQTANKPKLLSQYKQQGGILLLQYQAGSYGLNLQVANYLHLFETPSEPKAYKQLVTRAHRAGQQKTVFCYDYCLKGSVDERIITSRDQGRDLREEIIEGRARW